MSNSSDKSGTPTAKANPLAAAIGRLQKGEINIARIGDVSFTKGATGLVINFNDPKQTDEAEQKPFDQSLLNTIVT